MSVKAFQLIEVFQSNPSCVAPTHTYFFVFHTLSQRNVTVVLFVIDFTVVAWSLLGFVSKHGKRDIKEQSICC